MPHDAEQAHERIAEVRQLAEASKGVFGEDWPDWRPKSSWGPLRLTEAVGATLASSPTPKGEMLDQQWWQLA